VQFCQERCAALLQSQWRYEHFAYNTAREVADLGLAAPPL
jgi:hypothetical protein